MHAIDAAVGPEIKQHHLATQIDKAQWLISVQPLHTLRKSGGTDGGLGLGHKLTSRHNDQYQYAKHQQSWQGKTLWSWTYIELGAPHNLTPLHRGATLKGAY